MTYFTFLVLFLVVPIIMLLALIWRDHQRGRLVLRTGSAMSVSLVIGVHVLLAVMWTTPWDNYLVATGVWWYDPALVNGMTIGYVPIEEYTFFVLQPVMTGLWLLFLMSRLYRLSIAGHGAGWRFRAGMTGVIGVIWLIAVGLLLARVGPGIYLSLELTWALPPIMLQVAFGADILRRQWRLVVFTIVSATLFLSLADAIAIGAGTWTIDPAQSTGILLGGILPIEELLFFLLTNTLIVFGTTLALADESQARIKRRFAALSETSARISRTG